MVCNAWILALVTLTTLCTPLTALALTANVTSRAIDNNTRVNAAKSPSNLPNAPTYENCNKKRKKALDSAIAIATDIQAATVRYLDSLETIKMSDPTWKRFTRWFGTPTNERYQAVRKLFTVLPKRPLATMRYVCDERQTCGRLPFSLIVYATTTYSRYNEHISICPGFWLPELSSQRHALTLMHEWTHFEWETEGSFGTEDIKYGSLKSLHLARTNPDQAIHNADNYAFFAMDLNCVGLACNIL